MFLNRLLKIALFVSFVMFLLAFSANLFNTSDPLNALASGGIMWLLSFIGVFILLWLVPRFFGFRIGWLEGERQKYRLEERQDLQEYWCGSTRSEYKSKCSKCGFEIAAGKSAFCPSCGAPLTKPISDQEISNLLFQVPPSRNYPEV